MSSNNDTSTSGEATNRAPDGSAVDPDSGADVSAPDRRVSRRAFVNGIGATAAAGVATKLAGSPVGSAAAVDWRQVGVAASTVVGGPIAAIAFGASLLSDDGSEVTDAMTWNSYVDEYTRYREENLALDQTIASLERDVQLVENKAREEAIFRIYEQGVDSGTESDATAAAEAAINEAYATVQRAILSSWAIRYNRIASVLQAFNDAGISVLNGAVNLTASSRWDDGTTTNSIGNIDFVGVPTTTATLYDGESYEYPADTFDDGGSAHEYIFDPIAFNDWGGGTIVGGDGLKMMKPDPSDFGTVDEPLDVSYSEVPVLQTKKWADLLADLETRHSSMMGEVSAMVSTYFTPAQNGEIDLYQAVGPKHLTDTASTAKDYQEAAMAMRAMGYPMSEQVVTISVPTTDGDGLELTGRLAWTAHSGNTLAVGQTHFAENIPGSIFAAVNLPDGVDSISSGGNTTDTNTTNTTDTDSTSTGPGAEIIELTDEFDIISAEGADGVSFKDRSLASADGATNEEINQIFKENYTANKEATENVHDTATGGGGGWSGLNTTGKAIIVAALGALGLGVVNN